MPSNLEVHNISRRHFLRDIHYTGEVESKLSGREFDILQKISDASAQTLGEKEAHKVTIVGGVALRLLEKAVDLPNEGVFSGSDVDMWLCDTDDEKLKALRSRFKSLQNVPRIDIDRFLRPDEANTAIFHKIVQDKDKRLSSTALFGNRHESIDNPLEIMEIDFGSNDPIYTLSPSNLYHLYALRAVGGVKKRDWDDRKHKRLLKVNARLNEKLTDQPLRRPSEYPEFRSFRKTAKIGLIPQLLVRAVWLDNKMGRPYERLGLASVIR